MKKTRSKKSRDTVPLSHVETTGETISMNLAMGFLYALVQKLLTVHAILYSSLLLAPSKG